MSTPNLRMPPLRGALMAAALCVLTTGPAAAHPHVWITVETTILHDKGTFTGLKHKWTFDEFYTVMAIEGLDKNKDGKYDRAELAELAKVNIEGLKDFSYFTHPTLGGQPLKVGDVKEYWLEHHDGVLSLHFIVPFDRPILTEAKGFGFSVQDPSFFIAFDFAKTDPVKLGASAPKACRLRIGGFGEAARANPAPNEAPSAIGGFGFSGPKAISVDCNGS